MSGARGYWWEGRWLLAALVVLSTVPLWWPPIPPLVDLPGHMGRYTVQLSPGDPALGLWYRFEWRLIGNLGVDLLIVPMARLFGLELGVKLIVVAIPALTALGLIWIAREVHGGEDARVPPTLFFALPLAYGHPFLFGFVNFALAMALALLAFALWLRMARKGATRLRPWVFAPIACVIWVCHTFGWGLLGLLCFSAELVRLRDEGRSWVTAATGSAIACVPMALPLIPMLAWRAEGAGGFTGDWFDWVAKILWLQTVLRDRWAVFDIASVALLAGVIGLAAVRRDLTFSRNLGASALILALVFVLLPRIVFGSAYADMRLTPYLFAIALVAIRPRAAASRQLLNGLAIAGLMFFTARTAATTASFALASTRTQTVLTALDHVPPHARVVAFVGRTCRMTWSTDRLEHIPAFAIVRRHAFSNDQWAVAGAQPMKIIRRDARGFVTDPSQLVTTRPCASDTVRTLDQSLRRFPRRAFDYVWLIDPPAYDARLTAGLVPVWANGRDRLFRVEGRP